MPVSLADFTQEKECVYKEENYSVRDNGAIMRHNREGMRERPTDNKWSFGNVNKKTGYLDFANERVHRIVAFAFLGEPPTSQHVVDHIDTNRQNNRPENLRWLTKLENALNNPITQKRIIIACGSIEAFIENPSLLRENDMNRDISWMRRVTPEEAKISYEKLLKWAESDKQPSGNGQLGEWIYNSNNHSISLQTEVSDLIDSLTQGAVQRNWRTPTEFPNCPAPDGKNQLIVYANNIQPDAVFSKNIYGWSKVINSALIDNKQKLVVWCETMQEHPIKPYTVAVITYEENKYIHESVGSYFSKDGAEKQFTLQQGLEWTGGDSIDDYC
jgi:hypothetical protein